jgi:hypothetical protein
LHGTARGTCASASSTAIFPICWAEISTAFAKENINIENMVNKSKKDYAYTLLDIAGRTSRAGAKLLKEAHGMLRDPGVQAKLNGKFLKNTGKFRCFFHAISKISLFFYAIKSQHTILERWKSY